MPTRTKKHIGELETGYARALLELAQEVGALPEVADEVAQLEKLLAEQPDLSRLVTNRLIGHVGRHAMLERMFASRVSVLVYRFLQVLSGKGRLYLLPDVLRGFDALYAQSQGRVEAEVTVAADMGDDLRSAIAQRVGLAIKRDVTLTQRVDPSLIGGLKLRLGDQLIDASVTAQLRAIRQRMTQQRN